MANKFKSRRYQRGIFVIDDAMILAWALHVAFGALLIYATSRPVPTAGGPAVTNAFSNVEVWDAPEQEQQARDAAIAKYALQPPQTSAAVPNGKLVYTIPVSSYNTSGAPYTITADNAGDFLNKIAVCPSNVCSFGGNVASFFRPSNQGKITSTAAVIKGDGTYEMLFSAAGSNGVRIPLTDAVCGSGYVMNTAAKTCDLSDIKEARRAGARDGLCFISKGVPDPFDPDCAAEMAQGILEEFTSPATPTAPPYKHVRLREGPTNGDGKIVQSVPQGLAPDGSKPPVVISTTAPSPYGGEQRVDTPIGPDGRVGGSQSVNSVPSTTGDYPGDTGGPGNYPVAGGGNVAGGVQCGNAGQPPCKSSIEGGSEGDAYPDGDSPDFEALAASAPEAGTFLAPLKEKFDGLVNYKMPAHTATCPVINKTFVVGFGRYTYPLTINSTAVCDTLYEYQGVLQAAMMLGYLFSAIMIFLSA